MRRDEFQKWLEQFPADAEVRVVKVGDFGDTSTAAFHPDHSEYYDCTVPPYSGLTTTHPYYQKRILNLGA